MQLGFVSAILGDLNLEEVLAFAAAEDFACVELMCWPSGPADRRYAGVTHVDVSNFNEDYAHHIRDLFADSWGLDLGTRLLPQPA
jgi:sugar phosphate isomerase/epimerase